MRIIDREWREAADLQPSRAGLALALGGAAVLRLWALGSGIPYMTGVDEPEVMDRAVRIIKTGDFNPHFFDYPSLYIYVQAAVGVVRFLAGAIWGQWSSLAQFGASDVYLWGRAVTAVAGIATVWVLYLAGLRWGARTAVLAAALLAVATKYNGAIALLMPLIACGMTPAVRPSRLVASLATLGAFLGASLIAAPYTLLDLPGFLNGFAHLATMYRDPANTVAAP